MAAIFPVEDAQLVRLPRDDGALLVAAWQLPPAHPLNTSGVTGVLAGKARGRAPVVAAQLPDGRGGAATAPVARDIVEGGLELLGLDGGTWARFRAIWTEPLPATGPVLSDLLLFDPWQGVPEELDAVLPQMLRGATVQRGGTIGLYWEWRDLPPGADTATVQIRIGPVGGDESLLAWSWQPSRPGSRGWSGSMALDLGRLGRGDFHLEVFMIVEGRTLRSRRTIRVD
jgi:hypothetical protein